MKFNEDEHQARVLQKHLDGDDCTNSNCCDAPMEHDRCTECGENCVSIADDKYDALCEKGDMERDERRDRDD